MTYYQIVNCLMNHPGITDSPKIVLLPDERMDTRNAALYLGLSAKTLAMTRCQGVGPKFVKRGKVFYYKDDLDHWLNAGGRVTSTTQLRAQATKSWHSS